MENREKTIEELNDILEKNYDAVNGYRKAAENAVGASPSVDTKLMSFFNRQVKERETFVTELKNEIRSLGGEPKEDGSIEAALHRFWIDVKTAFSVDEEESILEACITGEEECLEEYDDLLEESHVPISTRALLQRQRAMVQATLNHVKLKEEIRD